MGKIGLTINALILTGVFLGILYYRGNTQYHRWQNAPVEVHGLLPRQPRFTFNQIQGGQPLDAPPVHSLAIASDSVEASLLLDTLKPLRITPLAGLPQTQQKTGAITFKHFAVGSQGRYAFPAIEILAWPTHESLPADAPPLFTLIVINDHWAVVKIAGQELLKGRLSHPIAEPLVSLHDAAVQGFIETPDVPFDNAAASDPSPPAPH